MNKVCVKGQRIYFYRHPEPIPKSQVNFSRIEFDMDETWGSFLSVVAQFIQGGNPKNVQVKDGYCFVPPELEVGAFELCLRGDDGESVVASVNRLTFEVCEGFDPSGETPLPPSPDLYTQLIKEIDSGKKIAQSVREDADSGKFNGPPGKSPKIIDGNWYVWDDDAKAYVDTGIYSGGDAPFIGANGNWYVGKKDTGVPATGPVGPVGDTGATGPAGPAGSDGQDGITPTIGDNGNWYLGDTDTGKPSRGETGQAGADGRDGADGQPGADGKSAYQYAVEGGYTGTEEAFAAKLAAEIPTALPNPNALTFTGAVTGRYDGSEPLTVNIPRSGGGSGGGEAEFPNWRLIKTISFSADIASVYFDTDDNGNTFSLKEIMLAGFVPEYSGYIYMKPDRFGSQNSIWPSGVKNLRWWAASVNGQLKTMLVVSSASVIWPVDKDPVCDNDTISRLVIGASEGFKADCTMYVYGR